MTLQTSSRRWYRSVEGWTAFLKVKTPKLRWEVKPCSPLRHRCVHACRAEVLLAVEAPLCSLQGCQPSTFKVELPYLIILKHRGGSVVPRGSELASPSGFWVFSRKVERLFFKVESECLVHTVCSAVEIQTSTCYVCAAVLSCVRCRAVHLCVCICARTCELPGHCELSRQGNADSVARPPFPFFCLTEWMFFFLCLGATRLLLVPVYSQIHVHTHRHTDGQHALATTHTHPSLPLRIFGSILFGRNPALTLTVATHVEPPEATNHE